MTVYLLLPLLLTLGIAFATNWSIGARTTRSLGRVGVLFLAGQALVTTLVLVLVRFSLDQSSDERCRSGTGTGVVATSFLFGAAVLGGVVLAAVIADRRRQRAVLVWHLLVSPVAILLPYVVGAALVYWGLSCSS